MNLTDDVNRICFLDTETRSLPGVRPPYNSVTTAGTAAYFEHGAHVVILTYAIGMKPVRCVTLDSFDRRLRWPDLPEDLQDFLRLARDKGDRWIAAWNAGFDRAALTQGMDGLEVLLPENFIDIMAQAVASNLPPSLDGACAALKIAGKQENGQELINLFANGDGPLPHEQLEKWESYKSYAVTDTDRARECFLRTRPLPREEWEDYWVSEEINDRGMMIDVEFAERCAAIAELNRERADARIAAATGGVVDRVTQAERLKNWVYDNAPHAEVREIMVKAYDENSEDDLKPAKLGLDRNRIETLLAFYDALERKQDGLDPIDFDIATALEIRQWDGSASPGKFAKMLVQRRRRDDALVGSYVFNGAQQTGRYSSRGVQTHNLPRAFVGQKMEPPRREAEAEIIELINSLEDF